MQKKIVQHLSVGNIVVLFLILLAPFFFVGKARAANLTQAYVRLDRMSASTYTSGLVCAKSSNAGTEGKVKVTFPSGFTLSSTLTDWAVDTSSGLPSGATAWPSIAQATSVSGQSVTFPSGDLTSSTALYCFRWTDSIAALQTGTTGIDKVGSITTQTSTPTDLDSSSYSTAIISSDQISITATVPPTFDFSLSSNSDTFASNLSTTAQLSNGVTATIKTNAANGWVAWVKSANAALNSASTGATISTIGTVNNTVDSLTASNYGYLLDVTFSDSGTGTGNVTQASNYGQEYDGNSSNTGGTLSTSFQPIAASDGTTDNDTVTLKALARISAVQAAATDYTDTLTVVAAGRF